jgi:aspartate carbamoyltransferase catalytic subunit
MSELTVNHLLGIKYLQPEDINLIFETADHFKEVINRPIKKVPSLRDITIANIFLKTVPEPNYLLNWLKSDFQPM